MVIGPRQIGENDFKACLSNNPVTIFLVDSQFLCANGNLNPFATEAIVNQEHILELYQFKLMVAFHLLQELFVISAPVFSFFVRIQLSDCIVSLQGMHINMCYRR